MGNRDMAFWVVMCVVCFLVLVLWLLDRFLDKTGFYYGISEIFDKKRVGRLKSVAVDFGALYNYKPVNNYNEILKDFPLFHECVESRSRYVINEMRGDSGGYRFSIFDFYSWNRFDRSLGDRRTVVLLESGRLGVPGFYLRRRDRGVLDFFKDPAARDVDKEEVFAEQYSLLGTDEKIMDNFFPPELVDHLLGKGKEGLMNIQVREDKALFFFSKIIAPEQIKSFLDDAQNIMWLLQKRK